MLNYLSSLLIRRNLVNRDPLNRRLNGLCDILNGLDVLNLLRLNNLLRGLNLLRGVDRGNGLLLNNNLAGSNRLLSNLRSLNLIFNFVVFNSFNLSRLSDHFSFFLRNIFDFGDGDVFNSLDGNLFLDGFVFNSGNIFFLVFNGLVFCFGYFFRNSFDNSSFNFLIFGNNLFNLFGDFFLNLFVFNFSSFNRVVLDSRFSFNVLVLLGRLLSDNLRGDHRLLLNSDRRCLVNSSGLESLGAVVTLVNGSDFLLLLLFRLLLFLNGDWFLLFRHIGYFIF